MFKYLVIILLGSLVSTVPASKAEIDHFLRIEVTIEGKKPESFVLGLFKGTPVTSGNFKFLCSGDTTGLPDSIDKTLAKALVGSPFHRIIPNFMVQGGDFTNRNGTGGKSIYGNKFKDENFDIKHEVGVISMANAGPNTNGSQFFITTAETQWLDGRHTVFGKVVKNFELIKKIEAEGSNSGAPSKKVEITNCESVSAQQAYNN